MLLRAVCQAEFFQQHERVLPLRAVRHDDGYILLRAQPRKQPRLLKYAGRARGAIADMAGIRMQQPGDDMQKAGLSAAGRPGYGNAFALPQREGCAAQDLKRAEGERNVL